MNGAWHHQKLRARPQTLTLYCLVPQYPLNNESGRLPIYSVLKMNQRNKKNQRRITGRPTTHPKLRSCQAIQFKSPEHGNPIVYNRSRLWPLKYSLALILAFAHPTTALQAWSSQCGAKLSGMPAETARWGF